jgi:hypothetical protein
VADAGVGRQPEDPLGRRLIERTAPSMSRMVMMSGEALITALRALPLM